MRHVKAIAIGYAIVAAILGITLGMIGGASPSQVLFTSVVIVGIAYPLGDLVVLPATSNVVGIVVDAVAAGFIMWLMVPAARGSVLLLSLLGLGVGLYFFHLYLYKTVLEDGVPTG